MAIQMRKGSKDDFDPTKMLPGEWAVSIDSDTSKQMVWMCFRAGVVKRMGTYEDFKEQIRDATKDIRDEYKEEFNTILDQIETLAEQTSANTNIVIQIKNEIYVFGVDGVMLEGEIKLKTNSRGALVV